jgi:diguanylate cyclase (GGDEF)-like protein/PAS domain S-box-containing protein
MLIRDTDRTRDELLAELDELRRRLASVQTTEARTAWAAVEDALRETEERYRDLVEQASDLVFTLDLAGRFTSVNRAAERLLGYTRAEALQQSLVTLAAPGSRDVARAMLAASGEHARTPWELELVARDGSLVAVEVSTRPVRQGGRPAGLQGIARDVTARRRAHDLLRAEHGQQQILLDSVPALMLYVEPDGRIIRLNSAAARLFGLPVEDAPGRRLVDLEPREFTLFLAGDLAPAARGETTRGHTRAVRVGGEERWIQKDTVPSADPSGSVTGVIIFAIDITDRLRAERSSAQNQEQFRALFELAPVGIARLDVDGTVVDANRALLDMLGYGIEDVAGASFLRFVAMEEARHAADQLADLVSGRSDRVQAERRLARKDASGLWTALTSSVVRDADGSPRFIISTFENIADRKQAEDTLREANQRLTGWITELEQRTREISLLSEMGDLLQACRTADEAYLVIARVTRQLFSATSGAVSVVGAAGNFAEAVASWGTPPGERIFTPDECWALRRGRVHVVQDADVGLVCKHLHRPLSSGYVCVPMVAQGEALGVLTLLLPDAGRPSDTRQRLAMTVAEHLALSLANLRLHERLRSQSIRDPLTGLFNRRYMEESLEREMRRAGRGRHPVGILMLDLDHFKEFNDTFGHEAGDRLLREVGAILQRSIRGEDIACRYGGEEFTLILPQASLLDAAQRAEQIRDAIKSLHVQHRRQTLGPVSISVGLAIYPDHGPTGDAVLRAADAALYLAKARGRDRVVINPGAQGKIVDVTSQ